MDDLLGHSITYRVAMGPRARQKAFTLPCPLNLPRSQRKALRKQRDSHCTPASESRRTARGKLERLCRYVSRPAVAEERREA